jgi:hypothetical protein
MKFAGFEFKFTHRSIVHVAEKTGKENLAEINHFISEFIENKSVLKFPILARACLSHVDITDDRFEELIENEYDNLFAVTLIVLMEHLKKKLQGHGEWTETLEREISTLTSTLTDSGKKPIQAELSSNTQKYSGKKKPKAKRK